MAKKYTPRAVEREHAGSGDGLTKAEQRALRAERQRAEIAQRQRAANRRRSVMVGGAVVALAALVVVLVAVGRHQGSGGGDSAEPAQYWLNVGDPKAPHHLVIYEDFLCPHCGHMESESETKLQAEAKAGKVYISYRPFNLLAQDGPYSERAVNAYIAVKKAAGDAVALKFHNLLYQNQPDEPGPQDSDSKDLIALADQVVPKAEQAKVADAISNNTYKSAVAQITKYVVYTKGVQGTPTVYLDGAAFANESGTHTDPNFGGDENLADNMIKAVQ